MATATSKAKCFICSKEKSTYKCGGCTNDFCFIHLTEHRQVVSKQFDEIENDRNLFLQLLIQKKEDPKIRPLIHQIDKWEDDSIKKIKQTTEECKLMLLQYTNKYIIEMEMQLNKLTEQLKEIRAEDEFNEIDLNEIKTKLTKLTKEFDQPPNISIQEDSSSFINKISIIVSSAETKINDQGQTITNVTNTKKLNPVPAMDVRPVDTTSNTDNGFFGKIGRRLFLSNHVNKKEQCNSTSTNIHSNTKWKQNGITVAAGHGEGNELNQLCHPEGIHVDDDQTIYIADRDNHRIVSWKCGSKNGQIIAGGNGKGNRTDQLDGPRDVIVDKLNDSLIISDQGNRRVMRWFRRTGTSGETVISNIDCYGLTMDNSGYLYVSDEKKNEVRRWKIGESSGTIVAGGHGQGNGLNQLNDPRHIFVDADYSVYVSDCLNHRVMKWMKGAKEGIIVAGGKGEGNILTQLYYPEGVNVDQLGNVYVADSANHRVMRWCKGATEGNTVIGGNGKGEQSDQFNLLRGLSFDGHGNLYVTDYGNNRTQKFEINLN